MDPQPERAATSISLSAYVRLVRHNRNFRCLWLAQIVSEIGDWFYTLAIYSLLLQLTGRASSVALALVVQVLPQTLIGPAAGVINDRVRRKRVMITADLARLVIAFHAAGAISLHGVDGLSITSAGNADGCVFRAGTHCRDSEHNSPPRRASGQHAVLGYLVCQSVNRRIRRRGGGRAAGA